MYGFIHLSERRLPVAGQADGAVPHLGNGDLDFAVGPINIGDLPIGKNVKVVFTAQINANTTSTTVTNQGSAYSDQGGLAGTLASPILSNTTSITVDYPDVTVAVSPAAVAEDGSGTLTYTFTREAPFTDALTANFSRSGTTSSLNDYTLASGTGTVSFDATAGTGTITFAAGSATATLTMSPTDDTTVEPDETVILTVTAGTTGYDVGTPAAATGTITNDDTDVSVAIVGGASVTEDGATNLVYRFTRTGVTTGTLTANFGVSGTATLADSDYAQTGAASLTDTAGTVTFTGAATTVDVTINPTSDNAVEPDETLTLTVTAGTGYNVSGSAANGTITNDDSTVTIAVSPTSVAEDGAPNLVYTLTRTGFVGNALTVNLTVSGTASLTGDYTQNFATFDTTTGAATVSFAANASTVTVTIDPTADATFEADETVILTLAANGPPATTGGYP